MSPKPGKFPKGGGIRFSNADSEVTKSARADIVSLKSLVNDGYPRSCEITSPAHPFYHYHNVLDGWSRDGGRIGLGPGTQKWNIHNFCFVKHHDETHNTIDHFYVHMMKLSMYFPHRPMKRAKKKPTKKTKAHKKNETHKNGTDPDHDSNGGPAGLQRCKDQAIATVAEPIAVSTETCASPEFLEKHEKACNKLGVFHKPNVKTDTKAYMIMGDIEEYQKCAPKEEDT